VTAIYAVIVIIMRHLRFLFFATSNEAGHALDRGLEKIIPARGVVSARPDETPIITEPRAASQSSATTAAYSSDEKKIMTLPASLILLTLRRHRR
jgi:hypothetical protein